MVIPLSEENGGVGIM